MLIALDIDMVWFGIVMVIMLELSLITPPVGMNLFVLQGVRMRDPNASPAEEYWTSTWARCRSWSPCWCAWR